MTAFASLLSTAVSPGITLGSSTTGSASADIEPVSSTHSLVAVRLRASRGRCRARHSPVSAGSQRVGPRISRSASVTTSDSMKSVPVSQTVVELVHPSPLTSYSESGNSSPPSLVTTNRESSEAGEEAKVESFVRVYVRQTSPKDTFTWPSFHFNSSCASDGVDSSIKHVFS